MRRLVLVSAVVLGGLAGLSAPALAVQPPVPPAPVGVGHNDSGVCVYAFSWVPQCVPLGSIG